MRMTVVNVGEVVPQRRFGDAGYGDHDRIVCDRRSDYDSCYRPLRAQLRDEKSDGDAGEEQPERVAHVRSIKANGAAIIPPNARAAGRYRIRRSDRETHRRSAVAQAPPRQSFRVAYR